MAMPITTVAFSQPSRHSESRSIPSLAVRGHELEWAFWSSGGACLAGLTHTLPLIAWPCLVLLSIDAIARLILIGLLPNCLDKTPTAPQKSHISRAPLVHPHTPPQPRTLRAHAMTHVAHAPGRGHGHGGAADPRPKAAAQTTSLMYIFVFRSTDCTDE